MTLHERRAAKARSRLAGWLGSLLAGLALGLAAAALLKLGRPEKTGSPASSTLSVVARSLTPRPGWPDLVRRVAAEFVDDEIPTVAAGITFYALLALFPALAAFVSLFGLFAEVEEAKHQVVALAGILPAGAIAIIGDQLTRLAAINHGQLGLGFAASLLVSIWSANAGVKALMRGLNVAFEVKEQRGFLALNATSLALTLGAIAFAVVALVSVVAGPGVLTWLNLDRFARVGVVRWPALLVTATALAATLYRYGAFNRRKRNWLTLGAGLAGFGWLAMSAIFSWLVANFGHFDRTYGSLGAVVGFVTWIWISIMVMLAGAELDGEIERFD